MSYLEDVTDIAVRMIAHAPIVRIHQAFYNALVEYDREQANRITNTGLDPFYNQKNLGAFLEMLRNKGNSLTKIQS